MSVTTNSTGSVIVAVTFQGIIYRSLDSGNTWTSTNSNVHWGGVSSNQLGTQFVAYAIDGGIYTSMDGATWMQTSAPNNAWTQVVSDASGRKLVAVSYYLGGNYNGFIYTSTDFGVTWNMMPNAPPSTWTSVSSDSSGTTLVAVCQATQRPDTPPLSGSIYTSRDSGATWRQMSNSSTLWTAVATDKSGTNRAAIIAGAVYLF